MNYISSKVILAKIENNFDINYQAYLQNMVLWVMDAIDEMILLPGYQVTETTLAVTNYSVILPSGTRRILGVYYNDKKIDRIKKRGNADSNLDQDIEYDPYNSCSIENGYIITSFEEGDITIKYLTPALEEDIEDGIFYPIIPDNTLVHNAIEWYVIYCLLRKGINHNTYSLNNNNKYTNPALMWEDYKGKAMNAMCPMDNDTRREISIILRTFLSDLS